VAGNWLFSHRRWLNPEAIDDLLALEVAHRRLAIHFPDFVICDQKTFLDIVGSIARPWAVRSMEASQFRAHIHHTVNTPSSTSWRSAQLLDCAAFSPTILSGNPVG
jgi:hypothetical protein